LTELDILLVVGCRVSGVKAGGPGGAAKVACFTYANSSKFYQLLLLLSIIMALAEPDPSPRFLSWLYYTLDSDFVKVFRVTLVTRLIFTLYAAP